MHVFGISNIKWITSYCVRLIQSNTRMENASTAWQNTNIIQGYTFKNVCNMSAISFWPEYINTPALWLLFCFVLFCFIFVCSNFRQYPLMASILGLQFGNTQKWWCGYILTTVLLLLNENVLFPLQNNIHYDSRPNQSWTWELTHWGRVTHICVSRLIITGSDNGLSPGRRQAIIWTNAGILLIGPLGTNLSENSIEILTFSFTKLRLKVSSAKWRPFYLGLNELMICYYHHDNSYSMSCGMRGSPILITRFDL